MQSLSSPSTGVYLPFWICSTAGQNQLNFRHFSVLLLSADCQQNWPGEKAVLASWSFSRPLLSKVQQALPLTAKAGSGRGGLDPESRAFFS